ncbi:MAG: AAA family ATPase [Armatimonadetes bacterium]|nr:AAA family ATPase [Armatimonadota bacterium]
MEIEDRLRAFQEDFERLRGEIAKVIVGHAPVVEGVLMCLFADGHGLLEGVPGLGKTLLVRTLSRALALEFARIQFTPDLMPADIIGTNLLEETPQGRTFRFQKGPVFAHIVLADEINRATPKTQSALLEAMQEHSVTVTGRLHRLEEPFFVLATQNPIEMEGTYPLPEAQLDRFLFKLKVPSPTAEDLGRILDRTTGSALPEAAPVCDRERLLEMRRLAREVPIAAHVREFAARLSLATHPTDPAASPEVKRFVRYGASPRGAQALVLTGKIRALMAGRLNVAYEDIEQMAPMALRHRVLLNFEGQAEGIDPDALIAGAVESARAAAAVKAPV